MKTSLFYGLSMDPEMARNFLGDLVTALRIGPEQRLACINVLPELAQVMTNNQTRMIAERLAKELDLGFVETVGSLQCLRFLMTQLADKEISRDSTESLATDAVELAKEHDIDVPDSIVPSFCDMVDRIRSDVLPQYSKLRERKDAAIGILPSLKGFDTTIEFRAIAGNEFRIGMYADDYDPNITGLVPVISVALRVDVGPIERFYFQATEEEIGALIEELKSAVVSLRHAKRFAGVAK
jgi:hypothetical protein